MRVLEEEEVVAKSAEEKMLLMISKLNPNVFLSIARLPQQKNSVMMAADHISNFFMQLTSIVIYEKQDERTRGFSHMQSYS